MRCRMNCLEMTLAPGMCGVRKDGQNIERPTRGGKTKVYHATSEQEQEDVEILECL